MDNLNQADNKVFRGQNITFLLSGEQSYSFKDVASFMSGSIKFKVLFYPNNILSDIENNLDKIKKIDSMFIETDENPHGGWTPENKESDGYIRLFPKEGEWGECMGTLSWQETQDLELGAYTVEVVWSTDVDKNRVVMQQKSALMVSPSAGEEIEKGFILNE